MKIPKKWLDIADQVAEAYVRDFREHPEYQGPNFNWDAVAKIASASLYLSMAPNAYHRYGKRLEARVHELVKNEGL